MRSAILQFGKYASVYSGVAGAGFISSLVLFPLYAAYITPSDFGVVTSVRVATGLAQTIARMGLLGGMFRHLAEEHSLGNEDRARNVLWTGLVATTATSVVVTAALLVVAPIVVARTLGDTWILGFQLESAVIAMTVAPDIALSTLRAFNKSREYAILSLVNLAVGLGVTVFLVLVQHRGAYGVFWGDFLGALILVPLSLSLLFQHLGRPRYSPSDLRRVLHWGLAIVPAQMGEWIVTWSDRFFLNVLAGLGPLGVYSLGYRLGSVEQQLVVGGFQLAWEPFAIQRMHQDDAQHLFGVTITYILLLAMLPVILLGVLAGPLLHIMHAQRAYLGAAPVVALVALSYWFAFARYLFATPTFVKLRRAAGLTITIGTGLTNLVLNFLLISRFGMMGAAWATLGAYALGAIGGLALCLRIWRIEFEYYRLMAILVCACLAMWLTGEIHIPSSWLGLAAKSALALLLYLALLTLIRFWRPAETAFLWQTVGTRKVA